MTEHTHVCSPKGNGFRGMSPAEFVEFFCATHHGLAPEEDEVTRIQWAYPTAD